jgi:riboflavin synthase
MLSLRFWKRNRENVQVFEEIVKEIEEKKKLTYFGRQRTRKHFIKILMAINSKTLRDKNENGKQMWEKNVGTKRIINRDMKKVQICVMLSRNFPI